MAFTFEQIRPTQALIHLDHLRHNLRLLREWAGEGQFFCPMVKANAYGHGDVEVAKALEAEGVTSMGVGLIEEGALLRGMGIGADLLYYGVLDASGARACLEYDLIPVLSSWESIRALQSVLPTGRRIRVHLKFDTGMHRLGFETSQKDVLVGFFRQNASFDLQGILTHLHSAEDASDPEGASFGQIREFQELCGIFSPWNPACHVLNSAGLLNLVALRAGGRDEVAGIRLRQGARPGLALYGVSPVRTLPSGASLRPVMSFRSKIVRVRKMAPGEGASYGHSWKAPGPAWIGVVPVGYADGYHRALSNRAEVLVEGRRVPVVGNVTMDYLIVDLTELVGAGEGGPFLWKDVTLFGYDSLGNTLSVNELAAAAGTIPWEILTSVGERVPRVLLNGKE